jgi:hypothetical protein
MYIVIGTISCVKRIGFGFVCSGTGSAVARVADMTAASRHVTRPDAVIERLSGVRREMSMRARVRVPPLADCTNRAPSS